MVYWDGQAPAMSDVFVLDSESVILGFVIFASIRVTH